ncbi:MAG: hypothetical protein GDA43_07610 [Hormoscilla sp. SP5CHS1]|nr:hypothetical protein [Hormoscilla sp. SP5CHS1]
MRNIPTQQIKPDFSGRPRTVGSLAIAGLAVAARRRQGKQSTVSDFSGRPQTVSAHWASLETAR